MKYGGILNRGDKIEIPNKSNQINNINNLITSVENKNISENCNNI